MTSVLHKIGASIGAAALILVGMAGCGSEVGSPGTDNLEKIGMNIATRVAPTYLDEENVIDVDISMDICDQTDQDITVEDFTRHGANAEFNVKWLSPDPGPVTIDRYTVDFTNLVPGTPPIASYERFESFSLTAPGEVSFPVDFIDLDRKLQLLNDYLDVDSRGNAIYPEANGIAGCNVGTSAGENLYYLVCLQSNDYPAYAAKYRFYGKNMYGEDFKLEATVNFFVGNYNNCQ